LRSLTVRGLCLGLGMVACSNTPSTTVGPARAALACISADHARFVFPPEPRSTYSWNQPGEGKYTGLPEYSWEVYWAPPNAERGTRPHALWVVTYWSAAGPQHGDVGRMLAQMRPTVMTEDTAAGEEVSIAREDSAVTVAVGQGQVVLRVAGREAIARIFPVAPDSITLYRRLGADVPEEQFPLPVQRGRGSCGPPA